MGRRIKQVIEWRPSRTCLQQHYCPLALLKSSLTGRLALSRRRLTELRRLRSHRIAVLVLLTAVAVAVATNFAPTPRTVWTVRR